MATASDRATAWQLGSVEAIHVEGGREPAGSDYKMPEGKQWVRMEITVPLYRILEGLQYFDPDVGIVLTGDNIQWTGGSATIVGVSPMNYRNMGHALTQEYAGTDIWRDTMTYRWTGQWKEEASSDDDFENVTAIMFRRQG